VASIRKLPSGRYRVRWRDSAGHEHGDTAPTKKAAQELKAKVELEAFRGRAHDPSKGQRPFGAYLQEVLDGSDELRASTRSLYTSAAQRYVIPGIGGLAVGAIRPDDLRRFYTSLRKRGVGDATVEVVHRVVSRTLAQATQDGIIEVNPATVAGRKLRRADRKNIRVLSQRDVIRLAYVMDRADALRHQGSLIPSAERLAALQADVALIAAWPDDDLLSEFRSDLWGHEGYGRLVVLAAWTGMRFGEVAGLRLSSWNERAATLTISEAVTEVGGKVTVGPTKTKGSRRTIYVPDEVNLMLGLHVELRTMKVPNRDGLMFTTPTGLPLSRTRFRSRAWVPAVKFLEMDPAPTFHTLRHSHAAWLIERGWQPKVIQERLGHASSRTTQDIYGHLMDGLDKAAAESLSGPARGT
jgi:integrase